MLFFWQTLGLAILLTSCGLPTSRKESTVLIQSTSQVAQQSADAEPGLEDIENLPQAGGSGTLAPYLFDADAARAFEPLFLPYRKPPTADFEIRATKSYGKLRDLVDKTLKLGGSRPKQLPGRNFRVSISPDSTINAFEFDQRLVFNAGLISIADSQAMAMVMCHEAAHSARNHGHRFAREFDLKRTLSDPGVLALMQEINNYLQQQVKEGKYTHRNSSYRGLRDRWDNSLGAVFLARKTMESEADVVGALICADLGFKANEIIAGAKLLFERFGSGGHLGKLKDGTYNLKGMTLEELRDSLFPMTSHPSGSERIEQLTRLSEVFDLETNSEIAATWRSKYTDAKGQESALTLPFFGLVNEDTGELIPVIKGCH